MPDQEANGDEFPCDDYDVECRGVSEDGGGGDDAQGRNFETIDDDNGGGQGVRSGGIPDGPNDTDDNVYYSDEDYAFVEDALPDQDQGSFDYYDEGA